MIIICVFIFLVLPKKSDLKYKKNYLEIIKAISTPELIKFCLFLEQNEVTLKFCTNLLPFTNSPALLRNILKLVIIILWLNKIALRIFVKINLLRYTIDVDILAN